MALAPILCALLLAANSDPWFFAWIKRVDTLCNGNPAKADAKKALKLLNLMEKEAKLPRRNNFEVEEYIRYKRGCCEFHLGNSDRALKTIEEAISRMEAAGQKREAALGGKGRPAKRLLLFNMHRDLGAFYLSLSKTKDAKRHIDAALTMVEESRDEGFVIGNESLQLQPKAFISLDMLNAICLQASAKGKEARNAFEAVKLKVAAERKSARKRGETVVEWDLKRIECETHLAELDGGGSKIASAIQRWKACLRELQVLEDPQSTRMQFECRISFAQLYWKIARFDDARVQLDEARKLLRPRAAFGDLTTERGNSKLLGARATLQLERVAFTFDPEVDSVLQQLAEAENLAKKALDVLDSDVLFTASKENEIAQIHEYRGRIHSFKRDESAAQKEYDLARGRYDTVIRRLESIPLEPENDFVLQVRRCRARLLLRNGKEKLPVLEKEAAEILERFTRKHDENDVSRGEFLQLLLEIEEQAGKPGAAARHAEKLRQPVRPSAGSLPCRSEFGGANQVLPHVGRTRPARQPSSRHSRQEFS